LEREDYGGDGKDGGEWKIVNGKISFFQLGTSFSAKRKRATSVRGLGGKKKNQNDFAMNGSERNESLVERQSGGVYRPDRSLGGIGG